MKLIGVDTETCLIHDRRSLRHGTQRVRLEPHTVPRLVCVTTHDGHTTNLFGPDAAKSYLAGALADPDTCLVMHNAVFDLRVLDEAKVLDARALLESGRVLDTLYLDQLHHLAIGTYDRPDPRLAWAAPRMVPRSLDALAHDYLGASCPKDITARDGQPVRLTFERWLGHVEDMWPEYQEYAKADAELTWRVARHLLAEPGAPWGMADQLRAAYVMALADEGTGIVVDRAEATRLLRLFSVDLKAAALCLVGHGLGDWDALSKSTSSTKLDEGGRNGPRTGPWQFVAWDGELAKVRRLRCHKSATWQDEAVARFHLSQKVLRERLEPLAAHLPDGPVRTPTGLLSITADDWAEHIPPGATDLKAWLSYAKLQKIIGAYLMLYSRVDKVYPAVWTLGARSGRMSYSSPSIQNIPKRRHGVRSLFVAPPGSALLVADYSMQELYTLAEAMKTCFGIEGPLAEGLRSGQDLHVRTAAALLGKAPADVTKAERQAAKALNFGAPGGLGAGRLRDYAETAFGVIWTVEEARQMRERWLQTYPDIAEYLARMKTNFGAELLSRTGRNMNWWATHYACEWRELRGRMRDDPVMAGMVREIEHSRTVCLPGGRVRAACRFTEGANTYFQGLASDVTKRAIWLFWLRTGLAPYIVVHDEMVVAAPLGQEQALLPVLERAMLDAFIEVCPTFGPYARVAASTKPRWGQATSGSGEVV